MKANALLILMSFIAMVTGVWGKADEAVRLRQRSSMGLNNPNALSEFIVEAEPPEQTLRVCNAYAYSKPLDIYMMGSKEKLTSQPLDYKACQDFDLRLKEGDQLDFRAGDLDIGTFYAVNVPRKHSSLLLIPHRRDHASLAMAFDSHAFSELHTAQIAVVDAYRGAREGRVKMLEAARSGKIKRVEDLHYSSVVAINPGDYRVALIDGIGQNITELSLNVGSKQKYVAMRVGTDDQSAKPEYPMELVVFPPNAGASCLQMFTAIFVIVLSQALWL